jgi:hypothetical protein
MARGVGVNNKALVIAVGTIQTSALQAVNLFFYTLYTVEDIRRHTIAEVELH